MQQDSQERDFSLFSGRSQGLFTKDDKLIASFIGITTKTCYAPLYRLIREGPFAPR